MTRLPITTEIDVVWRSIVGEARSCCYSDMAAVGYVFRERVLRSGWWGHDYESVCQNPSQVNAWGSEPNLRVMRDPFGSDEPQKVIWRCMSAAIASVAGTDEDAPIKAWRGGRMYLPSHYISRDLDPPDWATHHETIELYPRWESAFRWFANVPGNPPRHKR